MILSTFKLLYSKFFSRKLPNVPDFIIDRELERLNKYFYLYQNLSNLTDQINTTKYSIYFNLYFDYAMLARAVNGNPDTANQTLLMNLVIAIDDLLTLNKGYVTYLEKEKHNIMLNALLDKKYIPRPQSYKLICTQEEQELLFLLKDRIYSLGEPSNIDKNLITQIKDVINHLCPNNPQNIKQIKDVLDNLAKSQGAFTPIEKLEIYSLEAMCDGGKNNQITLFHRLKQEIATLQQVNEYLQTKL
jgi:hypothetical protein